MQGSFLAPFLKPWQTCGYGGRSSQLGEHSDASRQEHPPYCSPQTSSVNSPGYMDHDWPAQLLKAPVPPLPTWLGSGGVGGMGVVELHT